jgi:NADPH:quinone reductase-like Zn-dependent oxidoreductase
MRAVRYHAYGGIERLALEDAPRPEAGRRQARVRVVRAALNPKDALFRKGRFRALSGAAFPKTPGLDFAGLVLDDPTGRHPVGARVFGALDEWRCTRGTLADEVVVHPRELARLPSRVSFDEGAAVALVGLTALQALRDVARLEPGQRLLVNGASGGLGTMAIQVARRLGAHVTTISSAKNRAFCTDLGADEALAYDLPAPPGAPFDVVFDAFGSLPLGGARELLATRGVWVGAIPTPRLLLRDLATRGAATEERLVIVRPRTTDLDTLAAWLVDGSLRAVIDRTYPLANVADAFAHLESKRARGKLVVAVFEDGE